MILTLNGSIFVTIALIWTQSAFSQIVVEDQPARAWTNDAGKSITASLTRLDQGYVTLKRVDGKVGRLPLVQLSDDDQRYIRRFVAANYQAGTPSCANV